MTAVEDMKEASVGAQPGGANSIAVPGFEQERIAAHLEDCAPQLDAAKLAAGLAEETAGELAVRLRGLAEETRLQSPNLEELERRLTAMEDKLFNVLIATESESDLLAMREESAGELAPYRSRM